MISIILRHLNAPEVYVRLTDPFELIGFFFVAGYTFNVSESSLAFIRTKAKALLIPVLILGLINALMSYYAKGGDIIYCITCIFIQQPGTWDFLWFVVCLFTMELIFYPVARFKSSLFGKFVICLSISLFGYILISVLPGFLPWHIENACIFIIFLCIGYILRKSNYGSQLIAYMQTRRFRWTYLALIITYVSFVFAIKNYPIDIHLHNYGLFFAFMTAAWLGLVIVFGLSLFLEQRHNCLILRFLQFIGGNTLVYYAFQSKVINLLNIVGEKIGYYSSTYSGGIVYCLLTCLILIVPSYLIKRYTPFMLGRFRNNLN